MAQEKGLLQTCDRCQEWVFLKTTGDGDADGGYTRWNKFEAAPAGWEHVQVGIKDHGGSVYATLCPKCSAEWRRINGIFMDFTEEV